MPTLPNMGLITPTLGADRGTWDDKINAMFALVDEHDHTSGQGVQIPVAGLDIDADFAMGGNAVTGLGSLAFDAVTALSAGSKRLFVSSSDNELYWRTNGGTNVKLTSGSSINASLIGGIGGDYASVGAEVAFNDADQVYTFKDQSSPSKKWARVASGPVRIYENDTTESVYVEQIVSNALASSYTITWPAALPATLPAKMTMNPSGAMEYLTEQATEVIPAHQFIQIGSAHTLDTSDSKWTLGNSTNALYCPLALNVGDIINTVTLYVNKASDATNTLSIILVTYTAATGVVSATSTATLATNAPGASTITISGLTTTVTADKSYALQVTQNDATPSAADKIFGAAVTRTRV